MDFLNPALLYGMVVLAVPLLLHLLRTRRVVELPFSTLRFLRRISRRSRALVRFAQLLLLLLRLALVAAVVVAFARPWFRNPALSWLNPSRSVLVCVVDNSRSSALRWSRGEGAPESTLDRLKEAVVSLWRRPCWTRRIVVATSPSPHRVDDPEALRPIGGVDWRAVSGFVKSVIDGLGSVPVTVVAASDGQSLDEKVRREFESAVDPSRAGVRWLVLEPASFSNAGIVSVSPIERWRVPVGSAVSWTVEISMRGLERVSLSCMVDGSGRRVLQARDEGEGYGKVTFSTSFETAGPHTVEFRLPRDCYPLDDRFVLRIESVARRGVLLVNGAPAPADRNDEVFFLRKVYAPGPPWMFLVSETDPDFHGIPESLDAWRVIHLASPPRLPSRMKRRLKDYVLGGGTLCLWAGDTCSLEVVDDLLNEFDVGLRVLRKVEGTWKWRLGRGGSPLGDLLVRSCSGRTTIPGILSRKSFLLERNAGFVPASAAVESEDATPVIVAVRRGMGLFVFMNTSASDSWSNLPLSPLYPLLCGWMASWNDVPVAVLEPGRTFMMAVPGAPPPGTVRLIPPGSRRVCQLRPVPLSASVGAEDMPGWKVVYARTWTGGTWEVELRGDSPESSKRFVFVVRPRWKGEDELEFHPLPFGRAEVGRIPDGLASGTVRLPLDRLLLAFALMLACTESAVAMMLERRLVDGSHRR